MKYSTTSNDPDGMFSKIDTSLSPEMGDIHEYTAEILIRGGVPTQKITTGEMRLQSVLYMVYWFHRLKNNPEEQTRIRYDFTKYIGTSVADPHILAETLFSNRHLEESAKRYVELFLIPIKTVDLVITKNESTNRQDKEVFCIERTYYPPGLSLPGGIIREDDEDNVLYLPAHVFAALRIAGEKVLRLKKEDARYSNEADSHGKAYFSIHGRTNVPEVRLYPEDEGGYRYRENIKFVLRPSDPRHIVDTIAFKCEMYGEPAGDLVLKKRSVIMSPDMHLGGFAFGHHREIFAHIVAQTSVEKERGMNERVFIRGIIANPLESYLALKERFDAEGNSPEVPFKELFTVVDRMLSELFDDDINELCHATPVLAGIRDKAVISLRHVCLKNRSFCPYLSTLHAIAEGIAFFDIIARHKMGFYDNIPKGQIVEHNPENTPFASYHMYRYKYRRDQLMNMVPREILIPTYEPLSATDLMQIRGVPIRLIGLSRDFLYVDEFRQSPEEFFMHDCNHSWRMIMEDNAVEKKYGRTKEELIEESDAFRRDYLERIKIHTEDSEEEREMKKLKKIILFEIIHEDARPMLNEVIGGYIQIKEGAPVHFEVPRIDPKTGYMDVVDTLDTGISTLSYVRNKLQHGFYDHIDVQLPQIVGPKYRTAEWIARAAHKMLIELGSAPVNNAELDADGNVSYEWLLKRACAVGPDNVHGTENIDPAVLKHGDGARKVNPKRYQV